jgi:diguanylate cyclase (GGDEF)-like protein/PAS domain S-box-containing protein
LNAFPDLSGLAAKGVCLAGLSRMVWLTVAANLLITCCYGTISVALVVLLVRVRSAPYNRVIALLAAVIATCSAARLLGALSLGLPPEWVRSGVGALTILVAVIASIAVWPMIGRFIAAEQNRRAVQAADDTARRRLEEFAWTDSLTGLANRRQFDAFLDTEFRRARRTNSPLALILVDVDRFKPFNDAYGHPAGDACLQAIAAAASHQLRRAGDLAVRLAGDEFAVVLPATDEAGAVLIAERIVEAVRAIALLHPASSTGLATISAGVASIIAPALGDAVPSLLVERADTALYLAKNRGGDQVCSAEQAAAANARPATWAHQRNGVYGGSGTSSDSLHIGPSGRVPPRLPGGLDFVNVMRAFPFGVLLTDSTQPDDPIIFANAGFAAMTGYSLKETIGRNGRFLQGAGTNPHTVADIADAMRRGVPIRRELLNYRKNGEAFWNELITQPLVDPRGAVVGFLGLQIDQTARHRAETAKREAETRLAGLVENLPGYIFQRVLTADGVVAYSYFSQSYWRLLGIDDVPQLSAFDPYTYIHPADVEMVRAAVARSLASMSPATIEHRAVRADGTALWLRSQSTPRSTNDGGVVWDGVGIDITAEMASKESLAYLAYHDPLTGLCNRVLFLQTAQAMCAGAVAEARRICILSIDLHAFQEINDTLGPSIGDAVLRSVASRLSEFAGASGVAARLGGDEFGVATPDMPPGVTITDTAAALARLLRRPMQIREHEITIQAHVGATIYPFPDDNETVAGDVAEAVLKQSNLALGEAKRIGGGVVQLYSPELDGREKNRVVLRHSMRRGLHEQQFVLHYHPIVDLATGEILGAEALVRWSHPERGMQRPDLFIPEAESSGLIIPLGAWVLRTALLELREWEKHSARALRISINVSGIQLRDPGFLGMLDELLDETGADPRKIDLELTESVLINGSTLRVLHALKERGYRLAIDDFGTGYSSFRYLQTLPIEQVKIDQTFVRQMVIDSSDASIVRAIVVVAKSLELEIIAEGIETPAQREFLHDQGCRMGQGYLFSLPLSAEDFHWLLKNKTTLPPGDHYGRLKGLESSQSRQALAMISPGNRLGRS